jgi:hypothetical protein
MGRDKVSCVDTSRKRKSRSAPGSVILSGVTDSRSESVTQSKDPYLLHGTVLSNLEEGIG